MDENKNEMIDQSVLAQDVSDKIRFDFLDNFLVKPLDVVKVTKTFEKPVSDKKVEKDKNGVEAINYDEVETEVKEVDSDFRKGIVLKVPYSYLAQQNDEKVNKYTAPINIGDVVIFRDRSGVYFDLLKDSKMIRYYDIVAVER